MVRRYSFAQLLEGPGGGSMRGHVEVNNSARSVFHDHQQVKQPESRARDGAEITSDDGRRVILQKGGPALIVAPVATAWRGGRLWQVFPDRAGETRRPSFSNNSFAMRSSPTGDSHAPPCGSKLGVPAESVANQLGTSGASKTGSSGGANR
jgi:hypothetical protein